MKVRSVANGNIIDLPEDHGLIAAGIYEAVEEEGEEEVVKPARKSVLRKTEKPVETVAHAEVLTTKTAAPLKAPAKRRRKK